MNRNKLWSRASDLTLDKPDLYVVARFLDIIYRKGMMKKTNLHMLVGLNYPRFLEYLQWLEAHDLVKRILDDEHSEVLGHQEALRLITTS